MSKAFLRSKFVVFLSIKSNLKFCLWGKDIENLNKVSFGFYITQGLLGYIAFFWYLKWNLNPVQATCASPPCWNHQPLGLPGIYQALHERGPVLWQPQGGQPIVPDPFVVHIPVGEGGPAGGGGRGGGEGDHLLDGQPQLQKYFFKDAHTILGSTHTCNILTLLTLFWELLTLLTLSWELLTLAIFFLLTLV